MQASPTDFARYIQGQSAFFITGSPGNLTAMAAAQSFSEWIQAAGGWFAVSFAVVPRHYPDTVNTLLHYAMNLDDTGQGALLPQPVLTMTEQGPALSITYRQRKTMPDVLLIPQYSNDLAHWISVPADNIQQLSDDDTYTARYCASMLVPTGQALYLRVSAQPNNGPVTPWPVSAGGNGHYYQAIVNLRPITLATAEAYAAARGGYVVTCTSAAENDFVYSLINAPQYWSVSSGTWRGPLIGITISSVIIGTPKLSWVNNEGGLSYTNWFSGVQPTNSYRDPGVGAQFYGTNATGPVPTWNTFTEVSPPTNYIIEWDSDPGSN